MNVLRLATTPRGALRAALLIQVVWRNFNQRKALKHDEIFQVIHAARLRARGKHSRHSDATRPSRVDLAQSRQSLAQSRQSLLAQSAQDLVQSSQNLAQSTQKHRNFTFEIENRRINTMRQLM